MIMLELGTGTSLQISVCVSIYLSGHHKHIMVTGRALLTQLQKAVVMHKKHSEAFEKFSTTFPPDIVAKWDKMVDEWDNDKSKPNPYEEPIAGKRILLLS